ncbi:hypothetical protein M2322_003026 [Rhodoblastus acidophilus]|uniref:hypothetical protein n=1 Tax=Rhodoblastus acidophilus TaxID=1074 RepID=UPI0022258A16|nr:hypothetical protein [Rhodoblastus acidophilus]MCW2317467.1 hypothetical protein [Rhodoblastus acidophilus]
MCGTLEVVTPAPLLEGRGLFRGADKPRLAATATLQMARAKTYGFLVGGDLIVVMGFWPLADGREEVFLLGRPACEVGPHMPLLARRARLILARRLQCGVVGFVGLVRIGHAPGSRLARIAGFAKAGEAGGFELWER